MFLRIVLIVYIGSVSSTCCPNRWVTYEGSCYLFGHDAVHFTEAEQYCSQHNSHLVKVETKEENMFLKDFVSDLKRTFWLGMTDEAVEGIWQWFPDNSRVEFSDWYPGETSHSSAGVEDCAVFWAGYAYQWGDIGCTTQNVPLCEMGVSMDVVG